MSRMCLIDACNILFGFSSLEVSLPVRRLWESLVTFQTRNQVTRVPIPRDLSKAAHATSRTGVMSFPSTSVISSSPLSPTTQPTSCNWAQCHGNLQLKLVHLTPRARRAIQAVQANPAVFNHNLHYRLTLQQPLVNLQSGQLVQLVLTYLHYPSVLLPLVLYHPLPLRLA